MGIPRNYGGSLYAARVHARLGRELQELRERKGLSRSALSRKSGVSRDEIIEIEEGRVHPLADTLCQLAFGMDLTIEEMMAELDE